MVKTSTHATPLKENLASQAEDPKITITFMESQQDDYDFINMADYHAAPSTKVLTVQEWYAEQLGVPVSELAFDLNGRKMGSLGDTVLEDQIEDGDFIKAKRKLHQNTRDVADTEGKASKGTPNENN